MNFQQQDNYPDVDCRKKTIIPVERIDRPLNSMVVTRL